MMKLAIWGTGICSRGLVEFYERVLEECLCCKAEKYQEISFFIDSDIKKTKVEFKGKKVFQPGEVNWNTEELYVVIAVVRKEAIESYIEKHIPNRTVFHTIRDFKSDLYKAIAGGVKSFKPNTYTAQAVLYQRLKDNEGERFTELQTIMKTYGVSAFVAALYDLFKNDYQLAERNLPPASCRPKKKHLQKKGNTIAFYYSHYNNGGIQRVISHLMKLFAANGYKVLFITEKEPSKGDYELPRGVTRVVIGENHDDQLERCKRWFSAIKEYGVDVVCYHEYFSPHLLYDMLFIQSMGVSAIVECHTSSEGITIMKWEHLAVPFARADAAVVLSENDRLFWKERGIVTVFIPNPIALPELEDDYFLKQKKYSILWVGRMNQNEKQVLELPHIMKYVIEEIPDAELVMVGDACDEQILSELEEAFSMYGIRDAIRMTGYTSNPEIYYRSASVFLNTSRFEGAPMVLGESLSYGVPAVIYGLPNLEISKEKRGIISVPQNDRASAAKEIVALLKNENLRRSYSVEARRYAEKLSKCDLMHLWRELF